MGGEFLEVHGGGGQAGLDVYVGKAAAHGAAQAVITLRAAVGTLDEPAMSAVECAGGFVPATLMSAACAEQGGVVLEDEDGAGLGAGGDAAIAQGQLWQSHARAR